MAQLVKLVPPSHRDETYSPRSHASCEETGIPVAERRETEPECAGQVLGWLAALPLSFICAHLQKITTAGVTTSFPPLKKEQQG